MNEKRLNLIASYAKSGSNWTRMVLENYIASADSCVTIWTASRVHNGFPRADFDRIMGFSSWLLEAEEIWSLMPWYLDEACRRSAEPLYYKIHDANLIFAPEEIPWTVGAIYLARNPFDVAVSFSHHFGITYDKAIAHLAHPGALFSDPKNRVDGLLPIRSLTWSAHVKGWIDERRFPVEVLRYEDLLTDPMAGFSRMIRLFFGEPDSGRLARAIELSSLRELRKQEQAQGKAFHRHKGETFFRKGKAGTWREELSSRQIARILEQQGAMMDRLGYRFPECPAGMG